MLKDMVNVQDDEIKTQISCNRHLKIEFLPYVKHLLLCYEEQPVNAI
jgi:hypothetical protein